MSILYVIIIGALGGFLNCILFDDGFLIPSLRPRNNQKLVQLGFIGNIILGAAAGFLVYAFIAHELIGIKQEALIFLSGIGGGNVLISFLHKYQIHKEETRGDSLEKISKAIINKL